MSRRAAQRGDQAAAALNLLDHVLWRRSQRVRDHAHPLVRERDLELRCGGGRRPAEKFARMASFWKLRDAMFVQQLAREVAMPLWNHVSQLLLELCRISL